MSSEKAHLAAVVAFLDAAGAKPLTLGDLAKLKDPPATYTEVHVMQRLSMGPRREGLGSDTTQWRILTRAVAQRYDNAQTLREKAGALHEASLTVDGVRYFVERSLSDDPIGPDDGWWSGTSEYTY